MLPNRGQMSLGTWRATHESGSDAIYRDFGFSILTHTFNCLWADAYNHRKELGFTHFGMLHDDIGPETGWLKKLHEEMDATGADIVSVVNAIKNDKGCTSTGLRLPGRQVVKRLTLAEVWAESLPQTFCAADINPGTILAINTGCWLAKVGDWMRHFPGFRTESGIHYDPETDKMTAWVDSEDWIFAEWAHIQGLKVYATRAVKTWHEGQFNYPNTHAWGEWKTDPEYKAELYA